MSSHELEELEKLTDHVAIMVRGRIAAVGTIARIRDLLDEQPLSVRIDVRGRKAARQLAAGWLLPAGRGRGGDAEEGRQDGLGTGARNPRGSSRN